MSKPYNKKEQEEIIKRLYTPVTVESMPQVLAAKLMGKSRGWPEYLLKSGHIKPVMVGGERRVNLNEIREWVARPKTKRTISQEKQIKMQEGRKASSNRDQNLNK